MSQKINYEEFYLGDDNNKLFDPHNFQTGLFDCFLDLESCCIHTFCPVAGWMQISSNGDYEVSCSDNARAHCPLVCIVMTMMHPCLVRETAHGQEEMYNIDPYNTLNDPASFWCSRCRACQIHREIVIRGKNPESEWKKDTEGSGDDKKEFMRNVNAVSKCCIGGFVEKDRLLWPSGYGNVFKVEGRYHRPKVEVMGPTAEMKLEMAQEK